MVTRPGKSARNQGLALVFAAAAEAAVLRVLREADAALSAAEISQALRAGGVAKADIDRVWPRVQRRIKSHDQVVVEASRYRFTAQPRAISATEALELILTSRPPGPRKAALAAIVRAALAGSAADLGWAARRQTDIDSVRALAELASEVEELTINEVEPHVMVRHVRAWVKRSGLEPIDGSGEQTRFDRKRHSPVGPPIRDGAPVVVVRPGYVWKAPTEDVLIGKAVVEE